MNAEGAYNFRQTFRKPYSHRSKLNRSKIFDTHPCCVINIPKEPNKCNCAKFRIDKPGEKKFLSRKKVVKDFIILNLACKNDSLFFILIRYTFIHQKIDEHNNNRLISQTMSDKCIKNRYSNLYCSIGINITQ